MTPAEADELMGLAGRVTAYDPWHSPDNFADEMPLDLAIAKAFGVAAPDWQIARGSVTGYFSGDGIDGFGSPMVPQYTRSIDAAMTLIGDGWEWSMTNTGSDTFGPFSVGLGDPLTFPDVEARTLPLAICAAALKARAHQGGKPAPMTKDTAPVDVIQADREAAALVFDARARRASHPASVTMERHHAKVVRAGEGDCYDAVQAAAIARLAERERCAKMSESHADELRGKIDGTRKRRSDFDIAVFESAISEASSIAAAIRENAHVE